MFQLHLVLTFLVLPSVYAAEAEKGKAELTPEEYDHLTHTDAELAAAWTKPDGSPASDAAGPGTNTVQDHITAKTYELSVQEIIEHPVDLIKDVEGIDGLIHKCWNVYDWWLPRAPEATQGELIGETCMTANKDPGFYENDVHGNPIRDADGEKVPISPWKEEWSKLTKYPEENGDTREYATGNPLILGRRVELFDVLDKIMWMFSLTDEDWKILDEKYPPETYNGST